MNQEIADNSRACCNCANGTIAYPNCYCWQHKYCNGDKPYEIPKEAWLKTAERCEEFELGTPEEADVYLELNRIMSEESKDKNPKPIPSCKSCGFYENNCPFIRGKFIPYPNKVCKDYIHSAMKEQQPAEWRPFDKEVLTKIKELIDSHFSEHEQREVYKDWLDEHISQPAEWSEEDEEYLAACIEVIDNFYTLSGELKSLPKINVLRRNYAEKLKSWLKSLRPQPHWKPSKEQLNALHAFVGMIHPDARYDAVYSLLDELKAL